MTQAAPSSEATNPASAAALRVAALAVRLFELPGATVLRRLGEDEPWEPLASYGGQAERLLGELNHYAFLLDTSNQYVIVPDLD